MKILRKESRSGLDKNETLKGMVFMLPWLFGIIFFFIIPVVKSFLFSITQLFAGDKFRKRKM